MKLSARSGAIAAVVSGPTAWRRHEDALAERVTTLHGAASHALGGERNAGVLSCVAVGDLTGAVAALTAWCVDHLTVLAAALPLTTGLPSAFYEDLPYAATHPSVASDLETLREEASHAVEQAAHEAEETGTPAGAGETPQDALANFDMDAVVAKVLARMGSSSMLQEVTREILKPVVEAMVREELASKKH